MTLDVEEFWAIALGPQKQLLKKSMLFRGTVDACLVHPRDVFRFACLNNASSLIVAHNHPSLDLMASDQDRILTQRLIEAGHILGIPVLDHLLISRRGFKSFAAERWGFFG